METGRDALAGLRILIVEDEFLVASRGFRGFNALWLSPFRRAQIFA